LAKHEARLPAAANCATIRVCAVSKRKVKAPAGRRALSNLLNLDLTFVRQRPN
jgi:hypothetical protein